MELENSNEHLLLSFQVKHEQVKHQFLEALISLELLEDLSKSSDIEGFYVLDMEGAELGQVGEHVGQTH